MLLPIEQVREGFLHPDKNVRTEVAYYFSQAFSQDPKLAPLVIQSVEQYGLEQAFDHYTFLGDLVQTKESVRWLISQLRHWTPIDDEENTHRRRGLQRALLHADLQLLRPHAEELLDLEGLDDDGRDGVDEQISMPDQTLDQLWHAVEEWCESHAVDEWLHPDMLDFAERLAKAVAKHVGQIKQRVLSNLKRQPQDEERWLEWFAIYIAGEMRLSEAVPSLISLLQSSGELYSDEICDALARIGTPQIVTTLAATIPNADWDHRLFVACLLGRIHSELSVQTSLESYSGEADHVIRCHWLQSALLSFATEAIEPAREYILATPKDPDVLEVRSALLVACQLTGERFPEFEAWLADSKTDREFRIAWYKEHSPAVDAAEDAEEDLDKEFWDSDDTFIDDDPDAIPLTFVRRSERVGRNDPCPCGSGKKYKKCCYREGQVAAVTDENLASAMSGMRPIEAPPKYPIGTIAWYGPDDTRTTKIVAAVIRLSGAEPVLQRWVGSKVKENPKVLRQMQEFFHKHQVQSVVAAESNMGCPHEEGHDFPLGEDCPFCPYWKGKQGSAQSQ